MTESVDRLYRDYLARAEGQPGEADYLALHQGPEGTRRRHEFALTVCNIDSTRVLDVACGTALILDAARARGQQPLHYVGTDLLPERAPHVEKRLRDYHMKGAFFATPVGTALKDVLPETWEFDIAMAIGLCGFEGFASPGEIGNLIKTLQSYAEHGCVSVPGDMPGRGQQTDYCRCYDPFDLLDRLPFNHGTRLVDWGWDFLLHW